MYPLDLPSTRVVQVDSGGWVPMPYWKPRRAACRFRDSVYEPDFHRVKEFEKDQRPEFECFGPKFNRCLASLVKTTA